MAIIVKKKEKKNKREIQKSYVSYNIQYIIKTTFCFLYEDDDDNSNDDDDKKKVAIYELE